MERRRRWRDGFIAVRRDGDIAGEHVVARSAGDDVIATATGDKIVAGAAVDAVAHCSAVEAVVAVAAEDLQGGDSGVLLEVADVDAVGLPAKDIARVPHGLHRRRRGYR